MTDSSVHVLVERRLQPEFFIADIAFNCMLLQNMIIEVPWESEHPSAALAVVPMFLLLVPLTVFLPAEGFVAIIALMVVGMHGTEGDMVVVAIGVEVSTAAVRHFFSLERWTQVAG